MGGSWRNAAVHGYAHALAMSRLHASAEPSTAPLGEGSRMEPGPSPEPASPTTGLLDVLQLEALAQRLGQESVQGSMRALRLASREASAAVERMATHMVLAAGEAQPDTVALQRLAAKLPNVHRLTVISSEDGAVGFREAAGLLGAFALRPEAAGGVRTVELGLCSQALGPELPVLLVPFCNLQVRRISPRPHLAQHTCWKLGTAIESLPQLAPAHASATTGVCAGAHSPVPHSIPPFLQELTIECRPCLAFTPGALAPLGRGGLRSLTLSCDLLGADTLQHLGCLTGLTQLQVMSCCVDVPGSSVAGGAGAALRHLTALSGLTQLAHLRVELGKWWGAGKGREGEYELEEGGEGDEEELAFLHVELGGGLGGELGGEGGLDEGLPLAAELLAALPRAPLVQVGWPVMPHLMWCVLHN
jgi:hypothetical protein